MRTVLLVLAGVVLSVICIGWAESACADPVSAPTLTTEMDSSVGLQVDPLLGGDLRTRAVPVANCGDASSQCQNQPNGAPCGPPSLSCICQVIPPGPARCTIE